MSATVSNRVKQFLINGVPVSVVGGLQGGDAVVMAPQGQVAVGVRGLYGDGVHVYLESDGHWIVDVNCFETSEANSVLDVANTTRKKLAIEFSDGEKTVRSGTATVIQLPTLKISESVVIHVWRLESFNFKGTISGKSVT
ncbi:MAG TPA: hypothetical protein P5234_14380 [Thermoanaerobaculaceae bacterium]|nr:hypothetical protein [Thermoanaerobaculaceae bacterium]HRU10215.1 hypothetical protein [Thermoanaerobaculia bacterium]